MQPLPRKPLTLFSRAALSLVLVMISAQRVPGADDLAPLSDEFDDSSTVAQWQRIYQVEGWGADQLEVFDINLTRPGKLFMEPYTSTWFENYRGELTFKVVTNDFVVTTDVEVSSRSGTGPPQASYSLGGIMLRAPRNITPATWFPGGENYVFLSLGAGDPGRFQFEVKTTFNSNSALILSDATNRAMIQWARLGSYFIALRKIEGGEWLVHGRYARTDLPPTLQVGLVAYTDFYTINNSQISAFEHNQTVLTNGNPDLRAAFDYVRFQRPRVPSALDGLNFADPNAVSDAQLLSFLGANANPAPLPVSQLQASVDAAGHLVLQFSHDLSATSATILVQASTDLGAGTWTTQASKAGTASWQVASGITLQETPAGLVTLIDSLSNGSTGQRFARILFSP